MVDHEATAAPSGQGVSGEARCAASPDHADIMETIANADFDWQKRGYATALAEVRDMANVGRALMEALPDGYSYINCPSEIVADLQNERDETLADPAPSCAPGEVERLISDVTAKADQCDRLAEVSRSPACFEYRAKAQAYSEVITLLGALSPQGLDAKEGEKAYRCKGCGWKGDDPIAIGHPQNGCDLELMVPVERKPATPSQRLDAATVERWVPQIGQRVRVTDASEFAGDWARTDLWVSGISVHGSGDGLDVAVAEEWPVYPRGRHHNGQTDGWRVGATSCRDHLEPLATEPDQHGGRG